MQTVSSGKYESAWAEVERLTSVQQEAAANGQIEEVAACLHSRQQLLGQIGTDHASAERLAQLAHLDAQTMDFLRAQHARVGDQLVQLREGGRALKRYRMPVRQFPGLVDRVQ